MRDLVVKKTYEHKIIAILRDVPEEKLLPLAQSLYDGGIRLMEIPFDNMAPDSFATTAAQIRKLREAMGDQLLVGAGTVLTLHQTVLAYQAGASFIVSPNTDRVLIEKTRMLGMASIPGALTPSEACAAYDAGADFVKLFPAGDLGPEYLKNLCVPLRHIPFLAVGGINAENAPAFLHAGAVGIGVGGSLANKQWILAENYDMLQTAANHLVACCADLK